MAIVLCTVAPEPSGGVSLRAAHDSETGTSVLCPLPERMCCKLDAERRAGNNRIRLNGV
jgi:hypothetical protein